MQFVGNKEVVDLAESLSNRAPRPEVAEWVSRVIPRYVRKTTDLLSKFKASEQALLETLMKADRLPPEARQRVMVCFKAGEPIYRANPKALSAFLQKATEVLDWMGSLDERDRRVKRIERMSWPEAAALSAAWHTSILKQAHNVKGDPLSGARRIFDLDGGAYVAELETKSALRLEGRSMHHCVGGYWSRVASKQLRIVSLRDANGMPAVTIELNPPTTIEVEGYGKVKVALLPRPGVSRVSLADFEWKAAQVRGKSNHVPNKKWLDRVVSYFVKNGIKWDETEAPDEVRSTTGPETLRVYSVGRQFFSAPEPAIEFGESHVLRELNKGRHLKAIYESSGLQAIHNVAYPDGSAARRFFQKILPHCIDVMIAQNTARGSLTGAIRNSGMAFLMSMLGDHTPTMRMILSKVCALENLAVQSEIVPLVSIGATNKIELVVHRIPLLSLAFLSNGLVRGIEDEAIARIAPAIEKVLTEMEQRPDALHAVAPLENGSVAQSDIYKAFLVCGFADRLNGLTERVGSNLRSARANLVVDMKRWRRESTFDQSVYNRYMNLLADGYEDRIQAMIAEVVPDRPFVVIGRSSSPAAQITSPKTAPPVVKKYAIPSRARMAPYR